MDELLGAVLWAIAEFLLEAFLELGATAVLDVVSRAVEGVFTKVAEATTANRALATIAYALLGVLAGALSLLVLPHPLVHPAHPSRFHGISLLISPIITGLVMSSVGAVLRRRGKKVVPVESFGYGFIFALGMALVRFFFAK